MEPKIGWLSCHISEGMFPEEYTVECNSISGDAFSFFAPEKYIDSSQSRVKVNVLDCSDTSCLIYIPFTPLEGGVSRNVKVHLKDITWP